MEHGFRNNGFSHQTWWIFPQLSMFIARGYAGQLLGCLPHVLPNAGGGDGLPAVRAIGRVGRRRGPVCPAIPMGLVDTTLMP